MDPLPKLSSTPNKPLEPLSRSKRSPLTKFTPTTEVTTQDLRISHLATYILSRPMPQKLLTPVLGRTASAPALPTALKPLPAVKPKDSAAPQKSELAKICEDFDNIDLATIEQKDVEAIKTNFLARFEQILKGPCDDATYETIQTYLDKITQLIIVKFNIEPPAVAARVRDAAKAVLSPYPSSPSIPSSDASSASSSPKSLESDLSTSIEDSPSKELTSAGASKPQEQKKLKNKETLADLATRILEARTSEPSSKKFIGLLKALFPHMNRIMHTRDKIDAAIAPHITSSLSALESIFSSLLNRMRDRAIATSDISPTSSAELQLLNICNQIRSIDPKSYRPDELVQLTKKFIDASQNLFMSESEIATNSSSITMQRAMQTLVSLYLDKARS